MCTRLKLNKTYITPGMVLQYKTLTAVKQGKFGIMNGQMPNVRSERLTNYWAPLFANRAIVVVDAFVEKGVTIGKSNGQVKLACLFDISGDIAIITKDSNPLVSRVHHRMPVVIEDEEPWLKNGLLQPTDSELQFMPL